jgi:hypothetical protein
MEELLAHASIDQPAEVFLRFRALPVERIGACLDTVFDLHVVPAQAGWIASRPSRTLQRGGAAVA